MNYNKTIVAVSLDDKNIEALSQIGDLPFSENSVIHLVHVFEIHQLSLDFIPNLHLSPEDLLAVEKWGEDRLLEVRDKIGLTEKNCVVKCLISTNPRQEFLNYADTHGATLIVAVAKEREGVRGLFESSFTNFLNKFSRCNLLLLRPESKR